MLVQEVINDIEYDKMDMSELSFIFSMYIKTHVRTTQRHINLLDYRKLRTMLDSLIETFRN